ncbi:MAG: signal recognition particle-docking protein FtsY, partial [Peptostreptococcaceae bacterium]|nr:signal recognition particle-docking protein FtsY [Peptostreptococcaceae bacterium]
MFKKLFNFGKKKEENQVEEVAQSVEEVENIETEEKVVEAVDFKLSSMEELDTQEEAKSEENENVTETDVEETIDEIVEENNEEIEELVEEMIETTEEASDTVEEIATIEEDTTEKEEVIESNLDTTEEVVEEKVSLFNRLKSGLTKAKQGITDKIDAVLNSYTTIDEDLLEELEEILITADVGVNTTMEMIDNLRDAIKSKGLTNPLEVRDELKTLIENMLGEEDSKLNIEPGPSIILMVGVNGVGKTTTIGKLANRYTKEGKKVLLAAGDTFRAAAIEQLEVWANRSNVDIIKHQEGADPGAVIFDAVKAAKARRVDILICDTAGRLHNKTNLMNELGKVFKIVDREYPEAKKEVLLVVDA